MEEVFTESALSLSSDFRVTSFHDQLRWPAGNETETFHYLSSSLIVYLTVIAKEIP